MQLDAAHSTPSYLFLSFNSEITKQEEQLQPKPVKIQTSYVCRWASLVALVAKNPPASAGYIRDEGSIPGSGRSPGGGHGNPLQYSCLKNPMDRGAWQAIVHGVTNSQKGLKRLSTHALIQYDLILIISITRRLYLRQILSSWAPNHCRW